MAAWRTLGTLVLLLTVAHVRGADTYPLAETPKVGDCFRLKLDMHLFGEIRVPRDGKPMALKLTASATHEFPERILAVGADQLPQKVARHYEKAQAVITVNGDRSERRLRPERRLLVSQRLRDQIVLFSPVGPLTYEELGLAGEHLDTLTLTGLLPGKAVAVSDMWKVANPVVQTLCGFEGLSRQDLTCKLIGVKDKTATVSLSGSADGIILGAVVKLLIQGTYRFDLDQRRLTWLEWKQMDQRDAGPANPETAVDITTTVERSPIEQPKELSDVVLVAVPDAEEPPPVMTALAYRDPKGRYTLNYDRAWQMVGKLEQHLILRLMDRGDFVAQVTVTPWTKAKPGERLSPGDFRKAMLQTPGWEQEDELQVGAIPLDPGYWGYRIAAQGKLDGIKVLHNFYLVAGPNGDQVVLAFTLTPTQAQALGTRDLSLVGSLSFPK